MMPALGAAMRLFLFFTLLTGGAYPLLMTGFGQSLFPIQANGSLIEQDGKRVGSALIAQKFEKDIHFWPRPSAVDYNPLPSGGSNLGPTSQDLKTKIEERKKLNLTEDLRFASASGLDPHISLRSALAQAPRVAAALQVPIRELNQLIHNKLEGRQFGFLGEPRINVLMLNLALDERMKR